MIVQSDNFVQTFTSWIMLSAYIYLLQSYIYKLYKLYKSNVIAVLISES